MQKSILHECFLKKKLISDKQLYNKEIRPDINDRKKLKKELSRHESGYQYLIRKLKKVDKSIDSKIADYNSQAIRQKIGRHRTISKQDFWKLKKKLAPRNVEGIIIECPDRKKPLPVASCYCYRMRIAELSTLQV